MVLAGILSVTALAVEPAAREFPGPTPVPTLETTQSAVWADPPLWGRPTRAPSPRPTPRATPELVTVPRPVVTHQPVAPPLELAAIATWYCNATHPEVAYSRCTVGHPDVAGDQLYAAISPDLGIPHGAHLRVCRGNACIVVTVIDCLCSRAGGIDLYADAYAHLAPLIGGRTTVTIARV